MDIQQTPHYKKSLARDKFIFMIFSTDEELNGYEETIQTNEELEQKIIKTMIRLKCNYLAVNYICQLGSRESE